MPVAGDKRTADSAPAGEPAAKRPSPDDVGDVGGPYVDDSPVFQALSVGHLSGSDIAGIRGWFTSAADFLLNGAVMVIAQQEYRIVEIEFYFRGGSHQDHFTHCDEMQKEAAHWYFHRTGSGYKGGTYKGLDITCGHDGAFAKADGDESVECNAADGVFGGIILRAIESVATGDVIEGPCLVVNKILELNEAGGIEELVSSEGFALHAWEEGSPLYLRPTDELEPKEMFATARVGLTLKRPLPYAEEYVVAPLRYITEPRALKKGKPHLILALFSQGKSVEEVMEIAGSTNKVVSKYYDDFVSGAGRSLDGFKGKVFKTSDLCALHGAVFG